MKKGTIFRNLYQPGYESYFVFRTFSGNDALGVWVVKTNDGKVNLKWDARFPKCDIQKDREHFPIAGQLDLESLMINHVFNEVSGYKKRKKQEFTEVLT